jgi:hypothetical protein
MYLLSSLGVQLALTQLLHPMRGVRPRPLSRDSPIGNWARPRKRVLSADFMAGKSKTKDGTGKAGASQSQRLKTVSIMFVGLYLEIVSETRFR